MSNLQEKKEDYILSLDNSGQLTKMDIIEQTLNAIDFGYELCKREYEEKLRWIPVEEKLPETYSKILATIKSPECTWVEEIGFGEGRFQLPGRGDTDFVTHWMYVPEPPSFL